MGERKDRLEKLLERLKELIQEKGKEKWNMTTYDRYYVSALEDKEKSRLFLAMLFAYSDAFSLLYYRRKENEKYSQNVQKIKEQLEQFRIGAEIVKESIISTWKKTGRIL